MSGHSHAKTVKRVKDANDEKRGKIFSKLSRLISIAAKEGSDPETNSKLRQALEEARSFNMPKDNVARAIKRGSGETGDAKLEEITYEAYGPGGTAIIIETITDNKNRTLSEIKQVLQKYQGKLASEGSVKWLFERKSAITISPKSQAPNSKPKEELEMKAIEAGAEDIYWHKEDEVLDVYTKPEETETVKKKLGAAGIEIETFSLDWVAKDPIEIEEKNKEQLNKLFDDLDENEAVQDVYSNLKV